jgi:sugar phosphate isomerase/epimerase
VKLSISNIGWEDRYDEQVYQLMQKYGFTGIEIAPTAWVPQKPYEPEQVEQAKNIAADLNVRYGFSVSSMQSILYGKTQNLFGTECDREELYTYLVKAIDYASAIGCGNLVFGCPRNRSFPEDWCNNTDITRAIELDFFRKLGDYAKSRGTVLAMEANPPIYNTNYINTTAQALELVEAMDSEGFLLNLDVGTMIENGESPELLKGHVHRINHVHISEPGLKPVEKRPLHRQLAKVLTEGGYQGFISIEVGKNNLGTEPLVVLEDMMRYVAEIDKPNRSRQ